MPNRTDRAILRSLRTLFNVGTIGELTDGQLLERFATAVGEAAELAFAALVERHGPMVLRVCRLALRDPHDAEDAFQATFLILVKRARSLWVRDSLGPWLHRVAHRVATRARSDAARRRDREGRAAEMRPIMVRESRDAEDLTALLHAEIDRLPERYRSPVVLCDLQGLTHEKAARHLGWPIGTVKSRLKRAREILRGRLSRRDPERPTGLPSAEKGLGGTIGAVAIVPPSSLIESTVRAAVHSAAGKALAAGAVSARVTVLIEEATRAMSFTKFKLASAVLLIGAAAGAGVLAQSGARNGRGQPPADRSQPIPQAASQPTAGTTDSVPAYITQSRRMIIARLEEEAAEARARLDRTLKKVGSPDDPAAVLARRTLEDLEQRLARIDRVLVEAVDAYPTAFDFSGEAPGPPPYYRGDRPAADPARPDQGSQVDRGRQQLHTLDLAEWMITMYRQGHVPRPRLEANLAALKAATGLSVPMPSDEPGSNGSGRQGQGQGSQGQGQGSGQPQNASGQGQQAGSQTGNPNSQRWPGQGAAGDQPAKANPSQEQPGNNPQSDQSAKANPSQGQPGNSANSDQQVNQRAGQGQPGQNPASNPDRQGDNVNPR